MPDCIMMVPNVMFAQPENGAWQEVSVQPLVPATFVVRVICARTEADLFVPPDYMPVIIIANVNPVNRDMPVKTASEPNAPKENGQKDPWKFAINAPRERQP